MLLFLGFLACRQSPLMTDIQRLSSSAYRAWAAGH